MQTTQLKITYLVAEQHEHLGSFGILNMNGRIFDPNTATFFSPDPFVVDPSSTQAFNRYSYCLNNPLMYTDPSGEWIILAGALIGAYLGGAGANKSFNPGKWDWKSGTTWAGMIGGAFQGAMTVVGLQAGFAQMGWEGLATFGRSELTKNFLTSSINLANYSGLAKIGMGAAKTLAVTNSAMISFNTVATVSSAIANPKNAGNILMGNYHYNSSNHWASQILEGISRGSWESIQQNLGTGLGHFRNTIGHVDNVEFFDGATLINRNDNSGRAWGFTLGSMINSKNLEASIDNPLFMHEYGHTIQSKVFGPMYPFGIGIPSAISSNFTSHEAHSGRWYEKQTNRFASRYFKRYGVDWNDILRLYIHPNGNPKYPLR